jgi:hypothetical protein
MAPLNTELLIKYFDKYEPGSPGDASIYAVAFRAIGGDGIPGWDYKTFPGSDSGRESAGAWAASREDAQVFVRDYGRWRVPGPAANGEN